jgi:hypothetical protein
MVALPENVPRWCLLDLGAEAEGVILMDRKKVALSS